MIAPLYQILPPIPKRMMFLKKLTIHSASKRTFFRVLLLLTLTVICILAFSDDVTPKPLQQADKLSHFAAFFTLSWLTYRAFNLKKWQILLILMSYGLFIELVQSRIPGRFASFFDLIADLCGILVCGLLITLYNKWHPNRKS